MSARGISLAGLAPVRGVWRIVSAARSCL